jgi:uncharacterized protein
MKTSCGGFCGLLAFSLLAAGCSDAPQTSPPSPTTSSGPIKIVARAPDPTSLNPALLNAIKASDAAKVQELLAQGADPQTKTQWGKPALHLACAKGNVAIVETLLKQGADLQAQIPTKYSDDGVGYDGAMAGSPLTYAVSAGHVDIAKLLLDQGAGVNAPTLENRTPLMYAAGAELPNAGNAACVRLLIERGAEVNTPVPQGRGILTLASGRSFLQFQTNELAAQREIVETLRRAGARP